MKKILIVALLVSASCVDDDATRNAAQAIGLRDVVPGDYAPLSCGKDDSYSQHFTATNINGDRVSGVVCCGLYKSCTVRF